VRVLLDSSVILRKLFGEPDPLPEWSAIEEAYGSRLLPIEVGRVIDRARLAGQIDDDDVAALHEEAARVLRSIDIIAMPEPIMRRASEAMPTVVGTLDAIHLATALELARHLQSSITIATHDAQLARAARASGLSVLGA
jgi:predicted nucleic acid-binding protein